MTVFGPRCLLEASKSLPKASQEPAKSLPKPSISFKGHSTAFKSLPSGPQEDSKSLLCRPFYILGQKTQIPKLIVQARSPPALLVRAQHIATHCMQMHIPFFYDAELYICMQGLYVCTGHRVRGGRGHSGQVGCQRVKVCMESSGSVHGGLPGGLYTLMSSHPLDLQQIGTRREGTF